MKSRFSAREIALIVFPALALGAFALYSQRVEKVEPRGLYVEKFELVPATPLDVSRGVSHYLNVTLNYGGTRPDWWATKGAYGNQSAATPSTFTWTNRFGREFSWRRRTFAIGDELVVRRGGKSVVVKRFVNDMPGISVEASRYIVTHKLDLLRIPHQGGDIKFRSIYALRELEPLRWEKVVRRAGEKAAAAIDRNPHAKIIGWKNVPGYPSALNLEAKLRHLPLKNGHKSRIVWDELEIMDSRGRVFHYGPDFMYGPLLNSDETENPSETWGRILVSPNPLMSKTARPPLTLRGKISVNENWPIPFSHRLTP